MAHQNDGNCFHCLEIVDKFPDFNQDILNWFKLMQAKYQDFHISCAGRGEEDQEKCFNDHSSDAHYGQSAHNFNAAIDTFFMIDGKYCLDESLYQLIEPEIPSFLEWFGESGAIFYERPHFQLRDWKAMVQQGLLKLVE